MTEIIKPDTVFDVTDETGLPRLLRKFKCRAIVVDSVSPNKKIPHSMIFFLYETNIRYSQYKTSATTDHYF